VEPGSRRGGGAAHLFSSINTWLYVSNVMLFLACPSCAARSVTGTPSASFTEA
jgi:hypothetical protein